MGLTEATQSPEPGEGTRWGEDFASTFLSGRRVLTPENSDHQYLCGRGLACGTAAPVLGLLLFLAAPRALASLSDLHALPQLPLL